MNFGPAADRMPIRGILETLRYLISCRTKLPGMSLDNAFSGGALYSIMSEYEWFQKAVGQE